VNGASHKVIEIGGNTYRLVFKFGTLRLAEKELGESIAAVFGSGGQKVGFDAISAVFWAALQPGHRVTREKSDDLIDDAGLAAVMAVITEGISAYFGASAASAEPAPGDAGNAPPPKEAKKPTP
jgi:hypothetical protein